MNGTMRRTQPNLEIQLDLYIYTDLNISSQISKRFFSADLHWLNIVQQRILYMI